MWHRTSSADTDRRPIDAQTPPVARAGSRCTAPQGVAHALFPRRGLSLPRSSATKRASKSDTELHPPLFEHLVVERFERLVRAPTAGHHLFGPVQIFNSSSQRPVRRRTLHHVTH